MTEVLATALKAPVDMLPDIVRAGCLSPEDENLWIPLGNDTWSLPLCLNISEGYWVHLLKARKAGFINRHRHSSPVHVFTLKGRWHYPEKDWTAEAGTYVFEPPGDTHTLRVPEGGAEMIFLANVKGTLLYVDDSGNPTGFDDVFTRIESARAHYEAIGLGGDYVRHFIR
ncbi:MAG TPA: 2,4'-dihydroxyacetophenone dioxygenase family protein [Caulobacteraceae bacterium]|nr:2,4'-dihydroxyacetophenone dioxygenase family protein [Caulobacteraceae bacterium]